MATKTTLIRKAAGKKAAPAKKAVAPKKSIAPKKAAAPTKPAASKRIVASKKPKIRLATPRVSKKTAPPKTAPVPATVKAIKKSTPRRSQKLRDSVRTEDERLLELAALPSLAASRTNVRMARDVDPDALPPPAAMSSAEPSQDAPYIDRGLPIPDHYGLDRLMVVPRDANWLYAYWELTGGALDRLRFQFSAEVIDNSRWVLAVRALHSHERHFVDIDLRAVHWYLKVRPGTRFQIDLGFISQQGEFMIVVKGNEVTTPRHELSETADEAWMVTREDLTELLRVSGADELPGNWGASDGGPVFAKSETLRPGTFFSGHWMMRQH